MQKIEIQIPETLMKSIDKLICLRDRKIDQIALDALEAYVSEKEKFEQEMIEGESDPKNQAYRLKVIEEYKYVDSITELNR